MTELFVPTHILVHIDGTSTKVELVPRDQWPKDRGCSDYKCSPHPTLDRGARVRLENGLEVWASPIFLEPITTRTAQLYL